MSKTLRYLLLVCLCAAPCVGMLYAYKTIKPTTFCGGCGGDHGDDRDRK